ncbi:MAG: NADH-quinone oxidoreductase subunit C [Caldimicrobium sp.]
METLKEELRERFGSSLVSIAEKDCLTVAIHRENFLNLISFLREKGFNHLIDLCGVDYLNYKPEKKEERFEVVYHFFNMKDRVLVRVKVPIPEGDCWQYSLTSLWRTADWFERECYDMFGIKFKGHPDLRRILMPDDWEGYPLRKDYPIYLEEEKEWKVYKELKARAKGESL